MLVAGSLPPLEGSYNTKGTMTEEEIEAGYEVVIENLKDHVDFFIAETLGSIKEATGSGRALRRLTRQRSSLLAGLHSIVARSAMASLYQTQYAL